MSVVRMEYLSTWCPQHLENHLTHQTPESRSQPMTDDRLAEIERRSHHDLTNDTRACGCPLHFDVPDLIAEVRRLRRALLLSDLSRGVPAEEMRESRLSRDVQEDIANVRKLVGAD